MSTTAEPTTTAAFVTTLIIGVAVAAIVFVVFLFLRPKRPDVYATRLVKTPELKEFIELTVKDK